MKLLLCCVFLMCLIFMAQAARDITTFLKVCHQSDPLLDKCMKESLERLRPFLKTGIPELSIPSFEPLVIPEITMNQGKGSLNLQTTFNNLHLWGLSNFDVKDFRSKLEDNLFKFRVFFPYLTSKSMYRVHGRILMLPIEGSGLAEGNYTNVEGIVQIQGSQRTEDSKTYFHVDNVVINLDVSHVGVYFDNLFNGDKELGDAMNAFLNDNWKHVMKDMRPVLEESIGAVMKDLFNSMYNKIPLDEILPL
ncbi:protein takeout-like [Planococcus citri]|uniref:protein takeout-like n=1 Tax=Planococcus citri TaxID=170843 RepID=UPI0031FA06F5